jgi:hypothetical protein
VAGIRFNVMVGGETSSAKISVISLDCEALPVRIRVRIEPRMLAADG